MQAIVIDDSRAMRMILSGILRELGFDVREAADGREGLERVRQGELPRLALVDWNMPEMNGLEFLRAVRADPALAGVRVVMVSTETEMAQVSRALDEGADEYVMKPFSRDVLAEKLRLIGLV